MNSFIFSFILYGEFFCIHKLFFVGFYYYDKEGEFCLIWKKKATWFHICIHACQFLQEGKNYQEEVVAKIRQNGKCIYATGIALLFFVFLRN